jgi:hypothetical protein
VPPDWWKRGPFDLRGNIIPKVKVLAPYIVTIALFLALGIVAMITNLALGHMKERKTVTVSYPCIVLKGDKWVHCADLEMRTYVVSRHNLEDRGLENVTAKR